MADNKITEEEFLNFLKAFHARGLSVIIVGAKRVDHETFIEMVSERDPKLAQLIGLHLDSTRKLKDYIDQVYVVPAQPPQQVSSSGTKDSN